MMKLEAEKLGEVTVKPFKLWIMTLIWIVFVTIVGTLIVTARSCEEKHKEILFTTDSLKASVASVSLADSVYTYIFLLRLEHPDIVMAQCMEESGRFTSPLFKEGNNCTGMKVAYQRPTLATGVLYGHARFDSWRECIADYAIWQSIYTRGLTREAYLAYLDRVYAEKKGYSERINKIIITNKL